MHAVYDTFIKVIKLFYFFDRNILRTLTPMKTDDNLFTSKAMVSLICSTNPSFSKSKNDTS